MDSFKGKKNSVQHFSRTFPLPFGIIPHIWHPLDGEAGLVGCQEVVAQLRGGSTRDDGVDLTVQCNMQRSVTPNRSK